MLTITSTRLLIRETTADELPSLLTIYTSNPDFVEQNEGSEGEIGRYDLDRWQRDWHILHMLGSIRLACYLRSDNTPIGLIDYLEENEDGNPWLGTLVIHKDYQRQGFGTEAFRSLTDHFRQHTDWPTLRASIKTANTAGLAFLQHLGFQTIEEGSERFSGGIQPYLIMSYTL